MPRQFEGWQEPTENWSKLPHQFIEMMPDMKLAEIRVTLYLLRHTWGFGNLDQPIRITTDEFMSGRIGRNGKRLDNGTGLAKQSVITGLQDAVERGTVIALTDTSDRARIKKTYALRFQMSKIWTSEVQNLDIDLNKETLKESNGSSKEDPLQQSLLLEEEEEEKKKERKLSQRSLFLKALQIRFQEETGLPDPPLKNKRQQTAAGIRWWNPLWEIYHLYEPNGYDEGALEEAKDLISGAVRKMKQENLTIAAPQSIVANATALWASNKQADTSDSADFYRRHLETNAMER